MIEFDRHYYINETDVVGILKLEEAGEYPFHLKVRTRDGKEYGVCYQGKAERDREAKKIAQQVERSAYDRDRTLESIYNRLYLMDDRLRRVDKRGLRIWQQLKALLGVEVQE